jgi:large subunit ribosomal protein L24
MAKIRKNDIVKVITGSKKGATGKVLAVNTKKSTVLIEGLGVTTRHIRPSQQNPRGGKKEIHVGIDISKIALVVDEKALKTSRVGVIKKDDGTKTRVARALKNKEIK